MYNVLGQFLLCLFHAGHIITLGAMIQQSQKGQGSDFDVGIDLLEMGIAFGKSPLHGLTPFLQSCDPSVLFEDYKGASAKTDMCMELILNAVGAGHKILLFSQFTSMLDRLTERLKKEGIAYYLLTGSVNKEKRMQMVESFNTDDVPVFCISLKAGGTGLNLTAADIVIHYDPWWNVAVQNQATDRAHRIGQKHVVNVYKLVAEGTIEEKIIAIQERKKKLAEQVLEGEGMDTATFTREEILELLG